jgi:hypothetical protein
MRKTWIVVLAAAVMLFAGAAVASAQFRMDIDVPWWIYIGLSDALEADLGTELGLADIAKYAIVVPNIQAYYTFGGAMLKLGVGVRLYTVLFANFLYPSIMGEVRLGNFDVNLNVGGLAGFIAVWGGYFDAVTGPWATFDLSAGYRLTNWFRLGVGAFGVLQTEYPSEFPYVLYASAKFIVNPGKKTKVVEED